MVRYTLSYTHLFLTTIAFDIFIIIVVMEDQNIHSLNFRSNMMLGVEQNRKQRFPVNSITS